MGSLERGYAIFSQDGRVDVSEIGYQKRLLTVIYRKRHRNLHVQRNDFLFHGLVV